MRITLERIGSILGRSPKPAHVWEKQFDGFDAELGRLAQSDWERIPDEDLWYYIHDLAYVELQADLFRHVFPACLRFWYQTLMQDFGAADGDADFHNALMRGRVLDTMLTPTERQSVYDLFRDGFLDRVEAERGFVYKEDGRSANAWIGRFNALGIVAPVIQPIWEQWWALDHPGKAVSAVMYASGLAYFKGENPIYGVWTPESGGGGPYLTEIGASIFDWSWRSDNLAFLTRTLTVDYLVEKLGQAAETLADCPEADLALRVSRDARTRRDVIALRTADLVENLGRVQFAKDRWD